MLKRIHGKKPILSKVSAKRDSTLNKCHIINDKMSKIKLLSELCLISDILNKRKLSSEFRLQPL